MNIEAMYGIEFISSENMVGYGIVVLETERVFGGDSSFVYTGKYRVDNSTLYADIKCKNDRGAMMSIFGNLHEFNLKLEGTIHENEFILHGYVIEDESLKISIKLTRRAELP